MGPSQAPDATQEIVEFDVETESFKITFDSTRYSTYQAIVTLVSTATGRKPLDLTPVQYVIDIDKLDELVTESPTGIGTCDSVSFRYEGFEITVTSEEVVEGYPIENP